MFGSTSVVKLQNECALPVILFCENRYLLQSFQTFSLICAVYMLLRVLRCALTTGLSRALSVIMLFLYC